MICKMSKKILKMTIQEKKHKVLIVFDDMIADMSNNKNLNPVITELSLLPNHILKCQKMLD